MSNEAMPPFEEMPDEIPLPLDDEPNRCQQPGCTNSVTKPARGRTPKFCDEHKAASKSTGGRKANWPMAGTVEDALSMYLRLLGTGVTFVDPFDGKVIAQGAGPVAHEIVELARPDKKMRDKLELLCTPGKYGPLMFTLVPIVVPIMAHHNLLPQFVLPGLVTVPNIPQPEGGKAA